MQDDRGVNKEYRITTEAVVAANDATLKASGKLRALVAVFALGTVLLFIVVSILDALSALRAEWAQRRAGDAYATEEGSLARVLTPDFPDPDPHAPQWPYEAKQ
jgi:hypothetical protein